jgi:hypothetical protein
MGTFVVPPRPPGRDHTHADDRSGYLLAMTSDGRPPASEDPPPVDSEPTDPPVYREASTPAEEEEKSH